MEELFLKIKLFFHRNERNTWVEDDNIRVYLRKSKRIINKKLYEFLDIASVEVIEEKRNTGVFTKFLIILLDKYPEQNIYVESILNEKLVSILSKFNFEKQIVNEYQINMFLVKSKPIEIDLSFH